MTQKFTLFLLALFGLSVLSGCARDDSGFVGQTAALTEGLAPVFGEPRSRDANLQLPDPGQATVIVYAHGAAGSLRQADCQAPAHRPPRTIEILTTAPDTYVYQLCSRVTPDRSDPGSANHRRADELVDTLEKLAKAGVQPRNAFLSGFGAGGWSALLAMAEVGKLFNAAIVFAPACCGIKDPLVAYQKDPDYITYWRESVEPTQKARLGSIRPFRALVFAYDDDRFNTARDLDFLRRVHKDGVEIVGYSCEKGHMTYREDCQAQETVNRIVAYIEARKADYPRRWR